MIEDFVSKRYPSLGTALFIEELRACQSLFMDQSHPDYPNALLSINQPPDVLFIKGNDKLLKTPMRVAIVGSRHPSAYGKKVAYDIAAYLAKQGVLIVSGLAMGIDTMAHLGALDAGGKTLGVLANGVNEAYPKSNQNLYERILQTGVIISEKPFKEKAQRYDFPLRNRLISGMSQVVIIIEAEIKSGSLITAKHALNQGKTIFAVPGNIYASLSKGTNQLIYEGAVPLIRFEDVLLTLGMTALQSERTYPDMKAFTKQEEDVFKVIYEEKMITMTLLVKKTGLESVALNPILSKLMMEDLCDWVSLTEIASNY